MRKDSDIQTLSGEVYFTQYRVVSNLTYLWKYHPIKIHKCSTNHLWMFTTVKSRVRLLFFCSLYLKPWTVRIFEDWPFSMYIVAASESDEGLVFLLKASLIQSCKKSISWYLGYIYVNFFMGIWTFKNSCC